MKLKNLFNKPQLFFFILSFLILISSFFSKGISINFSLFYTNFEVNIKHLEQLGTVYFFLIGLNYLVLKWVNKKPLLLLTVFHIIFQSIALILLYSSNSWNWIGNNNQLNIETDYTNLIVFLSILIFIISFFLHFLNFIISIFLKRE